MAGRRLIPEPLAGRRFPDAEESAAARLEGDTEVIELERLGDWARVQTPEGDRWWVDGRRLQDAPAAAPPPARTADGLTSRTSVVVGSLLTILALGVGAYVTLTGDQSEPATPQAAPAEVDEDPADPPADALADVAGDVADEATATGDVDTTDADLGEVQPGGAWQATVDVGRVTPVLTPEVAVLAQGDGVVAALDRRDGTPVWQVDFAVEERPQVAIQAGDAHGVLGGGTTVQGVELSSGEARWEISVPGEVQAIEMAGTTVVVGGAGYVTVVDAATGEQGWTTQLDGDADWLVPDRGLLLASSFTLNEAETNLWALELQDGSIRWQVSGKTFGLMRHVSPDGALVFFEWDAGVTAFRTADGEQVWHLPTDPRLTITGMSDERLVLAGGPPLVLDLASGEQVWTIDEGQADRAVGMAADAVLVNRQDADMLVGIPPRQPPDARWRLAGAFQHPVIHDDRVVAVRGNQVVVIDCADGAVVAERELPGQLWEDTGVVVDDTGVLFVERAETDSGIVYVPL